MSDKITAKTWLKAEIAGYNNQLVEAFAKEPCRRLALSRNEHTFKIAAKLHMNQKVLRDLEDGRTIEAILVELNKKISLIDSDYALCKALRASFRRLERAFQIA